MKGAVLAATFSWGCERANQLGITPLLKDYANSQEKSYSEEKVRDALKELFSYVYYQVIARSNNIKDPFNLKVVRAHWIGNELLGKVETSVIRGVFQEMQSKYDKVILAYIMEPLIKTGSAHHNAYARHNLKCSVVTDGKYFYHLGVKRMRAIPEDLKNLAEYGRK